MVILVGGDGGRRAVRVGTVVALALLTIGFVLGRYAQVEVLGVATEFSAPAAVVVAAEGAPSLTLRTTPGDRNVAVSDVVSGTVVGIIDDHGSWLRVEEPASGAVGWVRDDEIRRTAMAYTIPPTCPVPVSGEVAGPAFAMVAPGATLQLVDGHSSVDGELWVGVTAEGLPGVGLIRVDQIAVTAPPSVEGECAPVAVDPTVAAHQH